MIPQGPEDIELRRLPDHSGRFVADISRVEIPQRSNPLT